MILDCIAWYHSFWKSIVPFWLPAALTPATLTPTALTGIGFGLHLSANYGAPKLGKWSSNGAPMGLQLREMGENNLGEFLFFLCFSCFCMVFWGLELFRNG